MKWFVRLSAGIVLGALAWPATTVAASCTNLEFVTVEPRTPVAQSSLRCDARFDRWACAEREGLAKFATTETTDTASGKFAANSTTYVLDAAPIDSADAHQYLDPLRHSPSITKINELRILAREVAGRAYPCAANHVYLGEKSIFGVGPVFVDSTRFTLNGAPVDGFIALEDGSIPHLPFHILSRQKLIEAAYYDLAVAHELAHGIFQDLYGLEGVRELLAHHPSRTPHSAAQITDPALALVEGFAEGFEAWLGEQYFDPRAQTTPFLEHVMAKLQSGLDQVERDGFSAYFSVIPRTIGNATSVLFGLDAFVTDFLKAERQQAIRDNVYLLRGPFVNLAKRFNVPVGASTDADMEALAGWDAESADAIYSKEGVVAHFVYKVLAAGLAPELFRTLSQSRPRDLADLAQALRARLDAHAQTALAPLYKSLFTPDGRWISAQRLRAIYSEPSGATAELISRLDSKLEKVTIPADLPFPRDLWIEYWNDSRIFIELQGGLDRINLASAPPGRLNDFFRTLHLPRSTRRIILNSFLKTRDHHPEAETAEILAVAWHREAGINNSDITRAASEILLGRSCFRSHCVKNRP